MATIEFGKRIVGEGYYSLVIAEIGINYEGQVDEAIEMVDAVF